MAAKKQQPTQPETKQFHQSWTVWFNTAIFAVGFITLITPDQVRALVKGLIPNEDIAEGVAAVAVALFGLVNIILRIYKTNQPISR